MRSATRIRRRSFVTLLAAFVSTGTAHAVPEPEFVVEKQYPEFEVRKYPAMTVAETTVDADMDQAGADGFRRLFRYISGSNSDTRKIEMTAPVTEAAVTKSGAEGLGYVVRFVMPAGATMNNLPQASDPLVVIRELPAMRVAVLRYSGRWTKQNYDEHLDILRRAVELAGLKSAGEATLSRYDPPYMPFFWRRNEIWLPVSSAGS